MVDQDFSNFGQIKKIKIIPGKLGGLPSGDRTAFIQIINRNKSKKYIQDYLKGQEIKTIIKISQD